MLNRKIILGMLQCPGLDLRKSGGASPYRFTLDTRELVLWGILNIGNLSESEWLQLGRDFVAGKNLQENFKKPIAGHPRPA